MLILFPNFFSTFFSKSSVELDDKSFIMESNFLVNIPTRCISSALVFHLSVIFSMLFTRDFIVLNLLPSLVPLCLPTKSLNDSVISLADLFNPVGIITILGPVDISDSKFLLNVSMMSNMSSSFLLNNDILLLIPIV